MGWRRPAVIVALGTALALVAGTSASSAPGVAASSGGTLRILLPSGPTPTLDPAVAAEPLGWGALWYGTCATLMAFRDATAPEGFTVRPEAAAGLPEVSRDGRTYVFTVRKGLRFHDGSPLTADNFARALGRVRDPAMRSEGASLFSDMRVSASGRHLRIVLRKPIGDLLQRLALAYACPVPLGFPIDSAGIPLMVGSGPYYVARYETGRLIVLERNRFYRGSRPHWVDRVVITFSGDLDSNIGAVSEGRAEVLGADPPNRFRLELARRYGVNERQFFQTRGTSIHPLYLNTSRPLFRNNTALRKAVNFALDRAAIVSAGGGTPVWRTPTDQILSHWMPGWVDHPLYPLLGPNLKLARQFAAGNLRDRKAVLWVSPFPDALDEAEVVVRNLREIGLEVDVRAVSAAVVNATASTPGAPYDMGLGSFPLTSPDPANLIIRLLSGENARKPADNGNYAYFDVPAYNRRMAAADRLSGSARSRAFSELDADIMRDEAPWAPVYEGSSALFVSNGVGCVKMHPVFRIDLGGICLR